MGNAMGMAGNTDIVGIVVETVAKTMTTVKITYMSTTQSLYTTELENYSEESSDKLEFLLSSFKQYRKVKCRYFGGIEVARFVPCFTYEDTEPFVEQLLEQDEEIMSGGKRLLGFLLL